MRERRLRTSEAKGFALVELVVALVVVGLLAAFSASRLLAVRDDAHRGVVAATADGFRTSVQLVNAKYRTSGAAGGVRSFVGNLDVNAQGFPVDTTAGNGAVNNPSLRMSRRRCQRIWEGALVNAPSSCRGNANCRATDAHFQMNTGGGASRPACVFRYRRDTIRREFSYNTRTGVVELVRNP